jgi:hypothetical protein
MVERAEPPDAMTGTGTASAIARVSGMSYRSSCRAIHLVRRISPARRTLRGPGHGSSEVGCGPGGVDGPAGPAVAVAAGVEATTSTATELPRSSSIRRD